jgi:hypothetical protein
MSHVYRETAGTARRKRPHWMILGGYKPSYIKKFGWAISAVCGFLANRSMPVWLTRGAFKAVF